MAKFFKCELPRIGICGCGTSLSMYEGIQLPGQNFQLVAVADPSCERRKLAVEKWEIPQDYSKAEDMFEKEELDLVVIATPPSSHLGLSLEAAEKGIHILVK